MSAITNIKVILEFNTKTEKKASVTKKETYFINISLALCIALGCVILLINNRSSKSAKSSVIEVPLVVTKFGFDKSEHIFESHCLLDNQNLGDLLLWEGITWDSIIKLDKISSKTYSIRNFRAKKPFTIVRKDTCSKPHCLIYEPDRYTYLKYYLDDSITIDLVKREYETCIESASGEIHSSLWLAMKEAGIQGSIIDKMEDALASSVDFHHTKKGDQFKLIFERKYIEGKPVGYGEVISAAFKNRSGEHFAVFYENDKYSGFYDLEGKPTKSTFLRAPVKYSRISSSFNRRRFHPIKKRTIPHLGTDYAAPRGTPIYSVSDGVITKAGYSKNNGKYVKIRHNDIYQTQYLHMHRFAPGIKKGVRVTQGQQIGQVGSTGLATGPHVCYRFWKYGKQVNHLRENFPPKEPLPKEELDIFFSIRDSLMKDIKTVPYTRRNNELEVLAENT